MSKSLDEFFLLFPEIKDDILLILQACTGMWIERYPGIAEVLLIAHRNLAKNVLICCWLALNVALYVNLDMARCCYISILSM